MSRTPAPAERRTPRFHAAGWVLSALALMLLTTAGWIRFRFGPIVLEQVILHLPLAGEEVGNNNLAIEAVLLCVVAPLLIVLLAALGLSRLRRPSTPSPQPARRRRSAVLPAIGLTVSLGVLLTVAGVPQYAAAQLDGRTFAPYYVTPRFGRVPAEPKNLVTIYLESMENTFADPGLFGQNLLAALDEATAGWARYDGLAQYPDGGWTMAGFVGTQCGIPLKSQLLVEGVDPNTFGEQVESYLPGATCLGDLLAETGYTSAYLGGADTGFAGKDTFLTNHGYDLIQGLPVWRAAGEDPANISDWGLSDHQLFSHARDTIATLRAAGEPFNLTILTLDTHEPPAEFPTCSGDDASPMATAIKCSMQAVAGFLEFLEDEGYLEDTVVVVMGDHLKAAAEGTYYKSELDRAAERTIVFRVWSPDPVSYNRPAADQFSVLPTLLDLLGFRPPGGRAGLGVSFVGTYPLEETALALPEEEYRAVVTSATSRLYSEFWREPRTRTGVGRAAR